MKSNRIVFKTHQVRLPRPVQVMVQALLGLVLLFLSVGCLVLRSQMDSNAPANPQKYRQSSEVVKLQKEKAELEMKLRGYDEQFRSLLGRIEEMETQVATEKEDSASKEKIQDLESALSEMLNQQEALKKEIEDLRAAKKNLSSDQAAELRSSKGDLVAAEQFFSTGNWAKAVEEFQKYRESNPKSPEIPLVTYKIGVCFQELGMKKEAKTFFNSVISKYPTDKAAKFAKFRLDSL